MIILAVEPRPIGPPILNTLSNNFETNLIKKGSNPTYQKKAVSDEKTIIKGRILKANINSSPSPADK